MNSNHPEPSAPRGVAERMAPHRVSDVAQTSPAGAPDRKQSQVASSSEPEAWPEAVDGANLLCSLSEWLRSYVWMRTEEADAIALWVVATWIVEGLYIAPILAVLSATKR